MTARLLFLVLIFNPEYLREIERDHSIAMKPEEKKCRAS